MDNNIVQTYINYKKSFVLLMSGISCCGKKIVAKAVVRDFGVQTNILYVNLDSFINKSFNKQVTLRDEDKTLQIIDWDDIDAYDWDAFNKHISDIDKATNGIVIVGSYFPKNKISFSYDFRMVLVWKC